jgi:hypothetical protein
MFGWALAVALAVALVAAVRMSVPAGERPRMMALMLLAYGARLVVSFFLRDLPLFSFGAGGGGDNLSYEEFATVIARLWDFGHPFYVTVDDYPALGSTTLPPNLFGMVFYLNGAPTQIGCTALIALLACLTCLNLYLLSLMFDVRPDVRFGMTAVALFLPSFFFYTSDTFKDGIVAFCAIGVLGSALRLARRASLVDMAIAAVCFLGLWLTRFYLVYALLAPIALGAVGLRSKSWVRQIVALLFAGLAIAAAVYYLRDLSEFQGTATDTFTRATSRPWENALTSGGSGVEIDASSPTGSLALKLLYTVLAPFPWQSGSLGLQLTKIECLVWYFVLFRAGRASIRLWRYGRADLTVMVSFIVPTTLAYAASFGNVGLIVRERIPLVMAVMLLAATSWTKSTATAVAEKRLAILPAPSRAQG